jgi:iron complex outermembrane receptor protein
VAHEDLNSYIKDTTGHRDLVTLAMDWRLKPGTVIDFEFEQSHREQISINGYSLLGNVLPGTVDPRVNLTRQYWTQPGAFYATTGSVRLRQELDAGWRWTTQYGAQRLKTDDRLTYGFGNNCYGYLSNGPNICDRFTSDGRFEIDDYRSENERRIVDALQSEISGAVVIGSIQHNLTLDFTKQRQLDRFPPMQAWNTAGEGSVYGGSTSSPDPTPSFVNTNRSEYSNEFTAKDRIELTSNTTLWTGLRHVSYNKKSSQNAATSSPSTMQGGINLPWLGVSTKLNHTLLYASHGHGLEQNVAPNNSGFFTNAGQILGVGRSRQSELGIRTVPSMNSLSWNAAIFQIERPLTYDAWSAQDQLFTRYLDGKQIHQGIDLGANLTAGQWRFGSQIQWMHAKITDVHQTTDVVGSTPVNVPQFVLRGMTEYRYASFPGLRSGLRVSHEGERNVTETGDIKLPAWTTIDATVHYDTKVNNVASTWTLGINNLEDKRYWRESPKQYGHYYLYPGAPRTFRVSAQFRM